MNKNKNLDLLLIHPPYHRRRGSGIVFPLGLGYLAAAVKSIGFNAKIIDSALYFNSFTNESIQNFQNWLVYQLKYLTPRLAIGIGPCTTSAVQAIKVIADIIKITYPEIPIIYGGPLTSIPDQESLFFDKLFAEVIVPGDGDQIICKILTSLNKKRPLDEIEGITTKKVKAQSTNVIKNLDRLPIPIRPMTSNAPNYRLSIRRNLFLEPFATIMTSRGCPFRCNFCVSGFLREGSYDRRSKENIIQEINYLIHSFGTQSIVFYDDAFFSSPDTLEKEIYIFADSLSHLSRDIIWQIEMRPNVLMAMDAKMAKLLYKIGCRQINVGIEKADSNLSKSLGKTIDRIHLQRICDIINTSVPEMRLSGTFIIGGPGETQKTLDDTIEFAISLNLLFAHFYPLELYPGTNLFNRIYPDKGSLWWFQKIISDDLPWGEIIYEDSMINSNTLLEWINKAYDLFYNRNTWQMLAKRLLKDNFLNIAHQVSFWSHDRFNLHS